MSKKILLSAASLLLAAGVLAGCTPNTVSLWCRGLGEQTFALEYAATNSSYDGLNCNFTVKDEEDFIEYLQTVEGYAGTYPLADAEGEAYLFISGGSGYYCTKSGTTENRYKLTPCLAAFYDDNGVSGMFAYPPAEDPFIDDGIVTIRDWEYFSEFYSLLGVQVDEAARTVVLDYYTDVTYPAEGTVTLTYTDGTFTCTVTEQ